MWVGGAVTTAGSAQRYGRRAFLKMGEANGDRLAVYREKRHFERTPEPAGGEVEREVEQLPIFVVQKHDATRLHYDLRLEVNGVLKSWAVPKGPSADPNEKRLAVQTEDHPMEYATFEGTIPEGEYGAGPVIVWDTGRYVNMTTKRGKVIPAARAIEQGHLTVWFGGAKMRGGYSLVKGHNSEGFWLLIKKRDEKANPNYDPVADQPESVLSGRTIEDLCRRQPATGDRQPQETEREAGGGIRDAR